MIKHLTSIAEPLRARLHRLRHHGLKILSLSLASGILALALSHHQNSLRAFNQAQAQFRQQQSVHRSAQDNASLLAIYQGVHQQMQQRGLIGPAPRLQWIEALSQAVNQGAVPQVRFTLEPTRTATAEGDVADAEGLGLSLTPLRLELSLRHEGDFFRLMSALRAQAQGLFSVQNCTLRRKDAGSVEASTGATTTNGTALSIGGECELLWYSLEALAQPVEAG